MYQYKVAQDHLYSLLPQPTPGSLNTNNKSSLLTKSSKNDLTTIHEHHEDHEEEKEDLEQQTR